MDTQFGKGNDTLLKSKTEAGKAESSWVLNIHSIFKSITLVWRLLCICGEQHLFNKQHTTSTAKERWQKLVIFGLVTRWYRCCCYFWIGKEKRKDKSRPPQRQIHYLLNWKRLKCFLRKSQTAVVEDWQTLNGSFMFMFLNSCLQARPGEKQEPAFIKLSSFHKGGKETFSSTGQLETERNRAFRDHVSLAPWEWCKGERECEGSSQCDRE